MKTLKDMLKEYDVSHDNYSIGLRANIEQNEFIVVITDLKADNEGRVETPIECSIVDYFSRKNSLEDMAEIVAEGIKYLEEIDSGNKNSV